MYDIEELKKQKVNGKYNAIPSPIDLRDHVASYRVTEEQLESQYSLELPDKIKDQGSVGSCVAHATSSVFEHLNKHHNGTYQEFSTGFIYGNKPDHTSIGMCLRDALKLLNNYGDVFESDFPYNLEIPDIFNKIDEVGNNNLIFLANNHKELKQYFQLQTPYDIKCNIKKYGYTPIVIPIRADSQVNYDFIDLDPVTHVCKDYTATWIEGTGTIKGYHCVYLYGWDDKLQCWLMANSWGTGWGKDGHCYLPYSFTIIESWGCQGMVNEPNHDVPDPDINKKPKCPIVQFILKVINWIINKFKK